MTPEEIIEGAIRILDEKGWCQGDFRSNGRVCLVEALYQSSPDLWGSEAYARVRRAAQEHSGTEIPYVAGWNDKPETTLEDVKLVLKKAMAD